MFKEIGQIASMLKNMPSMGKMKEEMERYQQQLGQITAEGDAGAGMVKVRVNGKMEVQAVTLSDEALKDRELLEDMIRSAVNQAVEKGKQRVAEEASKMSANLGLPAGLNMPGLNS
jgi:DNA-binding YbaB/EbfC family protein